MKKETIIGLGMCELGPCTARSRISDEKIPCGLTCSIYPEAAVKSFNRRGLCSFQDVRMPKSSVLKGKVNPLKASKRSG